MGTVVCLLAGWLAGQQPAPAVDLSSLLETLQGVGPQQAGTPPKVGNREAARAWEKLVQVDAAHLPAVLAGLDRADAVAANWICTAVDAIAERQLQRGGRLPAAGLERFVEDTAHAPRARRLAYEWLVRVDPAARARVFGDFGSKRIHDPSLEMRREAIGLMIDEAARLQTEKRAAEAVVLYRRALTAARDLDQVRLLAERLRKSGQPVDLVRHFGFLVRWKVIGPFDNREGKGFEAVYGPEKEVSPAAAYPGKHGTVRWVDHATADQFGVVNLNKAIVEEKGVAAYATTDFYCDAGREVEFRVTSVNAVKLWVNGALLLRHPVYHSGSQLDQHVVRATLQPGKNVILLKVCQNEQTQDWARHWGFQLRVCDRLGGAILSADPRSVAAPGKPDGKN